MLLWKSPILQLLWICIQVTETNDNGNISAEKALVEIVVQSWKAARLAERVIGKLDARVQSRYLSQFRFFNRKIDENLTAAGYSLVSLEGQKYESGMAISVINMDDFDGDDDLVIDQVIEPLILKQGQVYKTGTVALKKEKV